MSRTAGERLGPYEIVSSLGAGGMGEVFRAFDTRLRRTVALKVLLREKMADSDHQRRFLREARAASALNHPNIVTLYDIASDGSVDYLVMEYVPGNLLERLIPPQGLPDAETLAYATQMASGVAAAHAAGIVHRDLKPLNIIITREGQVKILDFGLAKLSAPAPAPADAEGETRTNESAVTRVGMIVGTVGYMSPEQVRGEPADARSDVFSLGCVFFKMATGKSPFARRTTVETLAAILKDAPPPLLRAGKPLRPEFEQLVLRCLAKNPGDRYQSARDLGTALQGILVARASTISLPWTVRYSRRNALAAAGSSLVVAAGAWIYWRRRPRHFDSLAVLPLTNATGNAGDDYIAEGISESVINRLSRARLKVIARATALRVKEKDPDPIAVGKRLQVAAVMLGRLTRQGNNLVVQAELVDTSDGTQIWGDKFIRPVEEVQAFEEEIARNIAQTMRLRLTPGENTQLTKHDTANPEAFQLYLQGQYYFNKFTEEGFAKAIECFNGAVGKDPRYARAYAGIAHSYAILAAEAFRPSKEVMPQAQTAATRALTLDPAVAEAHTALGIYHEFYTWDWKAAENELQEALALDPNNPDTLHFYGHYLQAVGRSDDAVPVLKRALDRDPLALVINAEYGNALYYARRYQEAVEAMRKTLDMDRGFTFAAWGEAQALERLGRVDEAIVELERVRSQAWSVILVELASAHAVGGRPHEARRILAEVKAGKQYVDPVVMAMAYAELHDLDETFRWLAKGYEERSPQLSFLQAEPKFDPLRSDPRYGDLLRKLKLS